MIKFNKYHVTNGLIKARVHYSVNNRIDKKECVTIYAKDYGRDLGKIFVNEYIDKTDSMTDYFDTGHVSLFSDHPLYKSARSRATSKPEKKTVKLDDEFKKAFDVFLVRCQSVIDINYQGHPSIPVLEFTKGQKYIRVIKKDYPSTGGSAYGFVNLKTGDVHKTKGWKTPNNRISGNIYDSNNGAKNAGNFGIN